MSPSFSRAKVVPHARLPTNGSRRSRVNPGLSRFPSTWIIGTLSAGGIRSRPRPSRCARVPCENAGRSVTYTNVVRAINKLGDWIGQTGTFDLPGTTGGDEGFIVLVQKGTLERPGAFLAAAKTEGL